MCLLGWQHLVVVAAETTRSQRASAAETRAASELKRESRKAKQAMMLQAMMLRALLVGFASLGNQSAARLCSLCSRLALGLRASISLMASCGSSRASDDCMYAVYVCV